MKYSTPIFALLTIAFLVSSCSKKKSPEQTSPKPTTTAGAEKKKPNPWASEVPSLIGYHAQAAYHLTFSRDGKILATTGKDALIKLWDTSSWELLKSLSGHRDKVMMATFSDDDKLLVSASADETARIWDVATGKQIKVLKDKPPAKMTEEEELAYQQMPPPQMNWAGFSPDGKQVITASDDFALKLWDISTGKKIKVYKDDGCRQRRVYRRRDSAGWASSTGCMDDGVAYLKFWDQDGSLSGVYGDVDHDAHYLAFDQSAKYIVAADGSLSFSVFSAQGSFLKRVLVGGYHFCVTFGAQDKTLLVGTQRGEILVFRAGTWTREGKLEVGEPVAVDCMAVHPIDGSLAVALRNGKILVFSTPILLGDPA